MTIDERGSLRKDQHPHVLKDRPIGSIVLIGKKKYKLVASEKACSCKGCAFRVQEFGTCSKPNGGPNCSAIKRSDSIGVIFELVK